MVRELARQRETVEQLRRQTQDLLRQTRCAMAAWQAAIDEVEGITVEAQRTLLASRKLLDALEHHAEPNAQRTEH